MFSTLSNIERLIAIGILAYSVFISYINFINHSQLKSANSTIEKQGLEIENAAIQAEYLIQSVNLSEESNAKLLKERASLAKINEQYSKDIQLLNSQHIESQQQIKQLRQSSNEATKAWANDCVPVSAVSLLKYARASGCNQNRSTD
ncbi:hypothetical protein Q4503_16575 [Colwellia sp. 6_MG-2023]|uniref:hypothetical protein n=1 Tax=Colwellia sp. 6_MG-2023 TaxID=3062676 RepID=UPI0026E38C20|nr:hypothetical protein [Colwellia sp. 6_MG-2023]MDO6489312.1 hypothetical protein [Colwellia sp. 6_MG-2023]